jgi:hypothetical protein
MRRITIVAAIMASVLALAATEVFAQQSTKPDRSRPTADAPEEQPERQPEKKPEKKPDKEPVKKPAQPVKPVAEPAEPVELKPVTGEKVWVRLKNGDTINGVAKGQTVEVHRGARYVKAKSKDDPGAGIRVWYVSGMNGFMFFPYATVEKVEFQGLLTEDEGIEIARLIEYEQRRSERERIRVAQELEAKRLAREAEKKAEEEAAAAAEAGEDEATASTKPGKGGAKDEGKARAQTNQERATKIRERLRRFPPEKWKASRLAEIKDRQLILNIYPSDEDRAFMESYDLWLEGYEIWRKEKASSGR